MKNGNSIMGEIFSWILSLGVALLVALFIISNIVSMTMVMEQSMEPTFSQGDRLIVNRVGYFFTDPERGEVVIFDKNPIEKGIIRNMLNEIDDIRNSLKFRLTGSAEKNLLIKRVIAVGGNQVELVEGQVFVNGEKLAEPYLDTMTYSRGETSWNVPEGKLFVLGDNRENSLDSRVLGFIDTQQVKGKVVFRIFPFSEIGSID
ncbi:MAG: signal peptidase I [Gudongella sp.]|nr:signal peptidase I [Gudongella sp.]